jgi:hypothetical protein
MRHTRVIHDGSCGIALKPFLWNDIQLPQFTYLATVIEVLSDAATCGPVPAELWAKKEGLVRERSGGSAEDNEFCRPAVGP